jgi:hypothetical protein
MEIVLKFNYNAKSYVVYKEADTFKYGYLVNDKIMTDLSLEDKENINSVLSDLSPSTNMLELTPVYFKNNLYHVFLDLKTNLRHFIPTPSVEDLSILNSLFNNETEYVFDTYSNNDKKYFKRFIKIGQKTIMVLISTTIVLSQMPNAMAYSKKTSSKPTTAITQSECTIDTVKSSLKNNKNLSQKEKDLFLSNPFYFEDNKQYMDFNYLSKTFSKMNSSVNQNMPKSVGGWYLTTANKIEYRSDNISNVKPDVITHEILHSTQHNALESALTESVNVMYNNEYFGQEDYTYDKAYQSQVAVAKALAEIIGPKPLKQYENTGKDRYITEALQEIVPNFAYAQRFIGIFNNYHALLVKCGDMIQEKQDTQYVSQSIEMAKSDIKTALQMYYEAKFNRSMDNDLLMQYYLDKTVFIGLLKEKLNSDIDPSLMEGYTSVVKGKCYINSKLRKSNNYIEIKTPLKISKAPAHYTLQEAEVNGLVTEDANGYYSSDDPNVVINSDGTVDYKGGYIYTPEDFTNYKIDDTNRYINAKGVNYAR